MKKQEDVNYKGMEELECAVRNLGMQRVLYELASIINSGLTREQSLNSRLRYENQFGYDIHHNTVGDRNLREKYFKIVP